MDPGILDSYAGEYQFETLGNRIYTFMQKDAKLFFTENGSSKGTQLFAESESTFFLKDRPYVFVFTSAEGQAPQLKIVEGANTYLSKRIK